MAWSKALGFGEPLSFQAAISTADLELLPTARGQFRAELTKVCMDSGQSPGRLSCRKGARLGSGLFDKGRAVNCLFFQLGGESFEVRATFLPESHSPRKQSAVLCHR